MTSDRDHDPAAEDTVLLGADETTQADGDWPVAEQYRVPAADTADDPAAPASDTVILTQSAAPVAPRRFPPDVGPGTLVAVAAIVGGLILAAVLFQLLRDDDNGGASTGSPPASTTPTTPSTDDTTATAPNPSTATTDLRDLEGATLDDARRTLADAHLRVSVRRVESGRPRGEVVNQSPDAGAVVAKGDLVTLFVSSGPARAQPKPPPAPKPASVVVPAVVGISASDALARLRDAGLDSRLRFVPSSEPEGTVVRQSPSDGATATRGATVQLDVARAKPAPKPQKIELPDLTGLSSSAARTRLRALGFEVTTTGVRSDELAGTVISQSPKARAELRKGALVRLQVSTGPGTIDVPDVTGLDEESARAELENAGFEVRVVDEPTDDPAKDGVVLRQQPDGGASVSDGSVVTIVVGRTG